MQDWKMRDNFKVSVYLQVDYLKNGAYYGQSYYTTLIGNHTQSIEWYHFQWPWLTSNSVARVCQHQLSLLYNNNNNKKKK